MDLPDLAATHRLAGWLALALQPGDVIALRGPYGAGKSEFARALVRARAGLEIDVPSPSFTLVQDYDLPALRLRHIDLYRIEDAVELEELGLADGPDRDEAWLMEWPECLSGRLGAWLELALSQGELDHGRHAVLTASPAWHDRLLQLQHDPAFASIRRSADGG